MRAPRQHGSCLSSPLHVHAVKLVRTTVRGVCETTDSCCPGGGVDWTSWEFDSRADPDSAALASPLHHVFTCATEHATVRRLRHHGLWSPRWAVDTRRAVEPRHQGVVGWLNVKQVSEFHFSPSPSPSPSLLPSSRPSPPSPHRNSTRQSPVRGSQFTCSTSYLMHLISSATAKKNEGRIDKMNDQVATTVRESRQLNVIWQGPAAWTI